MLKVVNMQLSIFGEYSIAPTPENISFLMTELTNYSGISFLPNIINAQKIDPISNKVSTNSCLGLVSDDSRYNIAFLPDRIDVTETPSQDHEADSKDLSNVLWNIMNYIMDHFKLTSNRLAANLYYAAPAKFACNIPNHFMKLIPYYDDKEVIDYSTRLNARAEIAIGKSTETLNVITEFSSGHSTQDNSPAIIVHLDINTIPENATMRFTCSGSTDFADRVIDIANSIISNISFESESD